MWLVVFIACDYYTQYAHRRKNAATRRLAHKPVRSFPLHASPASSPAAMPFQLEQERSTRHARYRQNKLVPAFLGLHVICLTLGLWWSQFPSLESTTPQQ
ncbi:hypothetical protein MHYP_G00273000 [Metynnis hypsauchen]